MITYSAYFIVARMSSEIFIGTKFGSKSELEDWRECYQDMNFVQLWMSDSRTIKSARKRGIKRHIGEKLIYFTLKLSCVHGGEKCPGRSSGKRKTR